MFQDLVPEVANAIGLPFRCVLVPPTQLIPVSGPNEIVVAWTRWRESAFTRSSIPLQNGKKVKSECLLLAERSVDQAGRERILLLVQVLQKVSGGVEFGEQNGKTGVIQYMDEVLILGEK